ncbi:MAG: hypothetical protein MUE90_07270 [Thermoanaerobaculales bacterium]|jgi:hypothetical protein|nr:hypothetical protein [Thermoanaerobaculales bacterium]
MHGRGPWLIGAAALIAVAAAILLARGCRRDEAAAPTAPPADFVIETARFESPELELELESVRGAVHPDYTDWACLLRCEERAGCRADVRLHIDYRSGGEPRTLTIGGRLDGARGEALRVGRAQRPAVAVDRIERVRVEVLAPVRPVTPGAPRPTPMM